MFKVVSKSTSINNLKSSNLAIRNQSKAWHL